MAGGQPGPPCGERGMTEMKDIWLDDGLTQVPYAVYDDQDIYARERERLFQGPTWNILGLE